MRPDERRHWLFPPANGRLRGIDLAHLDPGDEDDRRLLIEAEHPDLAEPLEDKLDEIVVDGQPMSPFLHIAMHEVVANQLWNDEPPEVWGAAERLIAAGYDRHEVLHMLGSALADELWRMRKEDEPFDGDRYAAALAALPESWEKEREDDDLEDESLSLELALAPPPADGTVFTHRVTDAEMADGLVAYEPDLLPLEPLLVEHGHLHLTGGAVAEPELDDDGAKVLAGPPGWLSPGRPGQLLGFRVAGNEVEVVAVTTAEVPDELCPRLSEAFDHANRGDGMPVTVAQLVNGAILGLPAPEALVLPPVGEVLAGCGFEVRGDDAAPEGTDWETFERLQAVVAVAAAHDVGLEGSRAVVMLSELYRLFLEGELVLDDADPEVLAEVAQMLGDPDVSQAFVDVALGASDAADVQNFVATIRSGTGRRHRAGLTWVASAAARHAADHVRAEALLRETLEADPEHLAALWDAAWYASDRGDARRAVEMLRRLEQLGDEEAEEREVVLRRYASPPVALAGRNDPCPCGSGRKHKHCCLGTPRAVPVPDRVRWIWEKLEWFLTRAGFEFELAEVYEALGSAAPQDDLLAASLVLFEDGAVQDFLDLRGSLLPDDERNLVAQWALTERSVHEVVALERGAGVTVRDLRTGDVLEVRERLGSTQFAVGDLLYAHVVPDGHTYQIVGGVVPVPLQLRDHLMAALDAGGPAVELAELLGKAWAPPEVLTMEGEPMVVCEARYRMANPAAAAALDAELDRDDDDRWSESVEVDGRTWVRGTVVADGADLVVSANSETRFRRLRERVEAAVAGLELVSERATPAAEMVARGEAGWPPPPKALPTEAADILATFVRQQEERWVDEAVPALGGLTPRQAAADPTWREQLVALLHEFDRHPPPVGAATFDTGRLRAVLGLEQ